MCLIIFKICELCRQFKDKTNVVGIYQGVIPILMVLRPEILKQIMITNFSHFANQSGFGQIDKDIDPIMGRNPFFLKDEEWKEKRGEIIPAFSSGRVCIIFILNLLLIRSF